MGGMHGHGIVSSAMSPRNDGLRQMIYDIKSLPCRR